MAKTTESFLDRQKRINQDLAAGVFASCYLIYGEQAYLRLQNRDKIVQALLGDGDAMNRNIFTGTDFTAREVIDIAETMPFLSERRVIVIENTELFSGADEDADALAEYLSEVPETTSMVFIETAADKRKRLYKAIEKNGVVLACDALDENTLRAWTRGLFKKDGLEISGPAMARFLDNTGNDMMNIKMEAEKLICYAMGDGEVTLADVERLTSVRVKDRIFDLIEAIVSKQKAKALAIYGEMSAMQTPPQVVLSLMTRQFTGLLQVSELAAKHYGDDEIARTAGLPTFVVTKKYKPCLRNYTNAQLRNALRSCIQADADYKSGQIDAGIAIELLIVAISS